VDNMPDSREGHDRLIVIQTDMASYETASKAKLHHEVV